VITGRVPSVRERYLVAELEFGINLAAASRRESNQEALIGFLAMVVEGVLVAQNLREFQRLEGLRLEDWSGSDG